MGNAPATASASTARAAAAGGRTAARPDSNVRGMCRNVSIPSRTDKLRVSEFMILDWGRRKQSAHCSYGRRQMVEHSKRAYDCPGEVASDSPALAPPKPGPARIHLQPLRSRRQSQIRPARTPSFIGHATTPSRAGSLASTQMALEMHRGRETTDCLPHKCSRWTSAQRTRPSPGRDEISLFASAPSRRRNRHIRPGHPDGNSLG
jgi:hypothetical protein